MLIYCFNFDLLFGMCRIVFIKPPFILFDELKQPYYNKKTGGAHVSAPPVFKQKLY